MDTSEHSQPESSPSSRRHSWVPEGGVNLWQCPKCGTYRALNKKGRFYWFDTEEGSYGRLPPCEPT